MKLYYAPSSPYVRKVMVTLYETGQEPRVERIRRNPFDPKEARDTPNPLGKVPCLITDDGQVLFDSAVIMEYLDHQHDGARLLPAPGPARWTTLRRMAVADGILETSVLSFIEGMRKPERQSKGWIAHNMTSVANAIDALGAEAEAGDLDGPFDLGAIAVAVALSFAERTFPDRAWRDGHARLFDWFDGVNDRPSMRQTALSG